MVWEYEPEEREDGYLVHTGFGYCSGLSTKNHIKTRVETLDYDSVENIEFPSWLIDIAIDHFCDDMSDNYDEYNYYDECEDF